MSSPKSSTRGAPALRRIRRRLASFLAALALLALPLRTVVACTMTPAESETHGSQASLGSPGEHGDHGAAERDAGDPVPDTGHTACPDLANCASAVLPAAPVAVGTPRLLGAPVASFVPVHREAPVRAIDPPPPKR